MVAAEEHRCSSSDSGCKIVIFHCFFSVFQHICGGYAAKGRTSAWVTAAHLRGLSRKSSAQLRGVFFKQRIVIKILDFFLRHVCGGSQTPRRRAGQHGLKISFLRFFFGPGLGGRGPRCVVALCPASTAVARARSARTIVIPGSQRISVR